VDLLTNGRAVYSGTLSIPRIIDEIVPICLKKISLTIRAPHIIIILQYVISQPKSVQDSMLFLPYQTKSSLKVVVLIWR